MAEKQNERRIEAFEN